MKSCCRYIITSVVFILGGKYSYSLWREVWLLYIGCFHSIIEPATGLARYKHCATPYTVLCTRTHYLFLLINMGADFIYVHETWERKLKTFILFKKIYTYLVLKFKFSRLLNTHIFTFELFPEYASFKILPIGCPCSVVEYVCVGANIFDHFQAHLFIEYWI